MLYSILFKITNRAHLTAPMALLGWVICAAAPCTCRAQALGPTPYLCFGDSPFNGLSFSYFYLETFEDHLFNVPGVTANHGGVTSVIFGPSIHDSVDCDDGHIDGSGLMGDSFFFAGGATGITFTFSAAVLGSLPTHAGIVWTDGGGTITFQAFDGAGALLATLTGTHADTSNNGQTAEDRFYGMISAGGIGSIRIANSGGGIEVDHLQYGLGMTSTCPADFNQDGGIDGADVSAFFAAWEAGDSAADVNNDGGVDGADVSTFFAAWEAGSC